MIHFFSFRFLYACICTILLSVFVLSAQQIPPDVTQLNQKFLSLTSQGKFAEALPIITQLAQKLPKNAMVLQNKALVHLNLGQTSEALNAVNQSLALDKTNATTIYIRGMTYLNAGRHEAALEDFVRYLKTNPKDYTAYYNCATTYSHLGRYKAAIENFNKCIVLNPNDAGVYLDRGIAKNKIGDPTEEQDYLAVFQHNPQENQKYNAYNNLGAFYFTRHEYSKARDILKKKIALRSNDEKNHVMLGSIALITKQYDEAVSAFSDVLKQSPQNINAQAYLAHAHLYQRNYTEALQYCNLFFQTNSQDITLTRSTNIYDQAVGKLDQGIQTPNHGRIFLVRGLARRKLKQPGWMQDIRKAGVLGVTFEEMQLFAADKREAESVLAEINENPLIVFSHWNFPENKQLYARKENDSAQVPMRGIVRRAGYDSVYANLYKNNQFIRRTAQKLGYETATTAIFSLNLSIHAEKSLYRIECGIKNALHDTILTVRDSLLCGDMIALMGQSNIVYGSEYRPQGSEYMRTFALTHDDNFWTALPTEKHTFPNVLAEELLQISSVPLAIFNAGIGGTKIGLHLPKAQQTDQNSIYGRLLNNTILAQAQERIRAMIWYLGEANTSDGYAQKFDTLYSAWRRNYPALSKVYVIQIAPSVCGQIAQGLMRETQRNFATAYSNVEVIASVATPAHDGCHYANAGYIGLGKRVAKIMSRDLYKSTDTIGISSPNLQSAAWTSAKRDEIVLQFSSNDALACGADTSVGGKVRTLPADAFLLDGKIAKAVSVRAEGTSVKVKFANSVTATSISYIPDLCYIDGPNAPCTVVYEGPWITTTRGVAALTFANVKIQSAP